MSQSTEDLTPRTVREVKIAREAYARCYNAHIADDAGFAKIMAAGAYPLPRVTRPRVVRDSAGDEVMYTDGMWWYRTFPGQWHEMPRRYPEYAALNGALLADLRKNPTEEVEATE